MLHSKDRIEQLYHDLAYQSVVKEVMLLADLANQYIDAEKPCLIGTVRQCQNVCDQTSGCKGIVFAPKTDSGLGNCFRKGGNITLSQCDHGTESFDTYLKGF